MPLKYATPTQSPNVDTFGNTIKSPDLVRDNRASASSPNTASVSSQSQSTGGNANLDGASNRVTNDPFSNPNGKNNTNRVGGGGNSVGNNPVQPRPVNNPSTTAPNSPPSNPTSSVSSPVASVSGASAFFKLPVVRALGVVGAVIGLVSTVIDLGESVAAVESGVTGQADRNKFAKQALDNATKRYEKALAGKQKTNPTNSKGSNAKSLEVNPVASIPFNSLGKADGWYRQYTTQNSPNGFTLKEDIGGGGSNPNTAYSWQYASTPPASLIELTVNGVTSLPEGADGSNIFTLNWYYVSNGFTARQQPEPVVVDGYAPPLDKPKDKGDPKDPNNPFSPEFFPWLPTVPAKQSDALQPNLQPNPANDNKPFKEPEKPAYAPVSPISSPIANSPNSGTSSPVGSKVASSNNIGGFSSTSATQTLASQTYANGRTNADYNQPTRQPVSTTPTRSDVSPSQSQNPLTKPLNPPIASPAIPTPNNAPDLGTIALGITALGVTTGAVVTGIDYLKNLNQQINNQTTPQAQQTNAQQGVCNAFQPNQCGFEGTKQAATEATNPIKDVATANNGLLANILAILNNLVTFLQGQLGKILSFLDKSIVDRAMGAANFAMNVHNALMLSNNLGKTLATVVDTALNFTGFKFYDATTGNATSASRAFSQNVSSIIVNLIGQDQYTELTNDWKVANRIYQSSTSLLNKTERLLGAQSKVAQKGNIDVANIGNALLVNGTVNANSYPPMAATKEANTPPDLMSDASSPLSSFAGQVRNLNTITKSVSSTLRNVSGIQRDFGKLADLTNSESKVRKSIRSGAASQAKIRAKFTFLQIKQIKTTGKK